MSENRRVDGRYPPPGRVRREKYAAEGSTTSVKTADEAEDPRRRVAQDVAGPKSEGPGGAVTAVLNEWIGSPGHAGSSRGDPSRVFHDPRERQLGGLQAGQRVGSGRPGVRALGTPLSAGATGALLVLLLMLLLLEGHLSGVAGATTLEDDGVKCAALRPLPRPETIRLVQRNLDPPQPQDALFERVCVSRVRGRVSVSVSASVSVPGPAPVTRTDVHQDQVAEITLRPSCPPGRMWMRAGAAVDLDHRDSQCHVGRKGPARDEMRRTIHNGLARAIAKDVEPTTFWDALELDDVSRVLLLPEDKCAIAIVQERGARLRERAALTPP
ncbi:hypothetical protein QBC47DRAFT_357249 [Echria macrotheca]|uniref:Uncharacterized protein n=1 Tax=Echria macrotheca TaxID=438768 RepID=A0AAJ0BJF9_9PEZI|nr:hypothetical protein QBC47DRAFT_357249 [Echria macrotheca]